MSEITIMMNGSASTSTDDIASIDVPEDGEIMGVSMNIRNATLAAARYYAFELSFLSSSQFTTNDARGVIAYLEASLSALNTNGLAGSNNNGNLIYHKGLSVNAGERLHLHLATSDTTTCVAHFLILFKFKGGVRAARRR